MQARFLSMTLSALLSFSGTVFAEDKTAEEHHAAALAKDAEIIAKMYRISHEDAQRRLKLQAAASERLVGQIKIEFKERFAGSYIEHDPVDRMVVRLKGNEEVANRKLEVDGNVLLVEFVTGLSYTRTELQEILNKNISQLKESIEGLQGMFVDEKTGEIVLDVYIKEVDEIKMENLKNIGEKILGIPVKIFRLAAKIENHGAVRGGGFLSSGCTSGFVVQKKGTSTRGVTTAAHCPHGNAIYSDWAGNSILLVQQEIVLSPSEDVKWYQALSYYPWYLTQMLPEFYAENMSIPRVVTGEQLWINTQPGQNVCHRGKTTGYSCGEVESVSYNNLPCGDYACDSTWISVVPQKNQNTQPELACYNGDSGGPWFIGSMAVGIHKGGAAYGSGQGECNKAFYMNVNRINALGVELVYGP